MSPDWHLRASGLASSVFLQLDDGSLLINRWRQVYELLETVMRAPPLFLCRLDPVVARLLTEWVRIHVGAIID